MRPKTWSYTPSDDNLTGFASNVTGASWTLSTTSTTDSMAHKVTIKNDSATDHSAKTTTLSGTDADGRTVTETLNLPAGSATVTSTKYYKTLTSPIVPSSTIGADTMDIGWSDVCVGTMYPLDYRANSFEVSLGCVISGTINYTIQHSFDSPFSTTEMTWFPHSSLASKTANSDGNYASPCRATRVLVNSSTSGATVAMTIIQSNGS